MLAGGTAMRLIDEDRVRATRSIMQRLQLRQQDPGERRPGLHGQRTEVDQGADHGLLQPAQDFHHPRRLMRVTERDQPGRADARRECRSDDAALITPGQHLRQKTIADRCLAAAGGPGHQQRVSSRHQAEFTPILAVRPQRDPVPVTGANNHRIRSRVCSSRTPGPVHRHQIGREFQKAVTVSSTGRMVGGPAQLRIGIADCNRMLRHIEQRQIALSIPDGHQVVDRDTQFPQSSAHP